MVRLDHRFLQMHPHHLRWMLSPDRAHKYIYSILFIHSHSPRQLFWLRKWTHTPCRMLFASYFCEKKKHAKFTRLQISVATNFSQYCSIPFVSFYSQIFANPRKFNLFRFISFLAVSAQLILAHFYIHIFSRSTQLDYDFHMKVHILLYNTHISVAD